MADFTIIRCPSCGVKNRVPVDKLSLGPRCGRCKTLLPYHRESGPVILNDSNFDSIVGAARAALVDCWAPWCGPCRMVGPVIEELAREFGASVLVGKLNIDENPQVAERYQIRSIPTLLFFKNGKLSDTMVGAAPAQQIRARLLSII